jgi:outer membrane receptor protein involved in Fe transport
MDNLKIKICVLYVVLLSTTLFAQSSNQGIVTGTIIGKTTNKPIEFASVGLFSATDSMLVTGTMTDADGKFFINKIADGNYYVQFNRIGFSNGKSAAFVINSQFTKKDLGKLLVTETTIPADNIVVTAEKPILNSTIDRKVYNIEQDIMSKSGSTSDLLQNIPSVTVDIDGNVSLRGSENVLILINGRASPLMGKNRAAVLQQMPASSIERIEVITNPSAKYKPEGTSGIINIVMKKNVLAGLNGSVSVNGGLNSRYNGNVSLNYNPGKLNIYGNIGYRKDSRNRRSLNDRRYYNLNGQVDRYLNDDGKSHSRPLSQIVALGLDYALTDRDHLGLSGNYFYREDKQKESSRFISKSNDLSVISDYIRSGNGYEREYENEATVYYDHAFAKEDHKLHIEYAISDRPEKENSHYVDVFYIPAQGPEYDNARNRQSETQNQLTIEYSNPLSENSVFEAGYEMELAKRDINNYADYYDSTSQLFLTDTTKTYQFKYDESVHAFYATFEHSFGKFSMLGGVRYEYVRNKPFLVTLDSTINNHYSSLYPSLHLGYELGKNSELQLNYSKRTNRPEGEDLNPFPEYHDPLNVEAGNPKLKPEYIHSIEFGWQLKSEYLTITPSIYYRYKYNGFTSVTEPLRDSILITTTKNLANDRSSGLELIINGALSSFLEIDISTNAFYNTIDASNIGFSKNKSVISWSGAFNMSLKLTSTTMLQSNSYYRSSRLAPQGKYLASFVSNFGAKQDLFNDKMSIVLTVSDIFKTRIQKMQLRTDWLTEDTKWSRDSRLLYLGVAYHFGKSTKKNEKKSFEYDNNQ